MTFATRYAYRPSGGLPKNPHLQVTLFVDAEEAWFWYMRSQKARWDGARFDADRSVSERPCTPDDIYRAIMALYRQKLIKKEHLRTLASYGLIETPPDPKDRQQQQDARLWDEALDRLTTVLKQKNLIDYDQHPAD